MHISLGFCRLPNGGYYKKNINITKLCHWLICGKSGSGKSYFLMYILFNLVYNISNETKNNIRVFIADFKGSQDFQGIVPDYAEFAECENLVYEFYSEFNRIKTEKTEKRILLLFDEYSSFCIWLESQDQGKKRVQKIKSMIAQVLMQGRSLPNKCSAWFWCCVQRADSIYFDKGSRDNYMAIFIFGKASKETKSMLLSGETDNIPEDYQPSTGSALMLLDGQELQVLKVPTYDMDKMKEYLKYIGGL